MTNQQQTAFENIVRKGEIARHEQFRLFPQCFHLNQKIVNPFVHIFDIISLFAAELEKPKIGISGKGLTVRFCQPKSVLLSNIGHLTGQEGKSCLKCRMNEDPAIARSLSQFCIKF